VTEPRQQWGSRLGFILAASGSAIGLGNIVFFSANAYTWGAGAFYVPYLVALLVCGLPVMVLEFGLGRFAGASFPMALGKAGGRVGEFAGWWAVVNALLITMYYCGILGWTLGMWLSALGGSLWQASVEVPAFGMPEGDLPNPYATFFSMISSWSNVAFAFLVWGVNVAMALRGTKSIERAVRVMMPLLWLFMIVGVIFAFSLQGGADGAWLLLTPNFEVLSNPKVWHGAFSQIFFTLSLGFGIMSAYASYLPRRSDQVSNALTVAGLNSTFEIIAGVAIFSLLFTFAVTPKASTLSMMFFVVPQGIAQLGAATQAVGVVFFSLLLLAGLTSSVSLLEATVSAVLDKFEWRRTPTVIGVAAVGLLGSIVFALPQVIDRGLASNGTLGLTMLDLIDHYAFSYGLLIVGLVECLIIGWVLPVERLLPVLNEHARYRVGRVFVVMVKFVIPAILIALLGYSAGEEFAKGALYGADFTYDDDGLRALPLVALGGWLAITIGFAAVLTLSGRKASGEEPR
jgi:NSS family neurotransmitter:Na+ symporter